MTKTIIGIMGPGEKATQQDLDIAYEIGKCAAEAGYTVMTGARPAGVMEAGLRGAKSAGGQTLGIIPSKNKAEASPYADIVVVTGLNSARNYINILTSDAIVACGAEAGTLSEIALAIKEKKHVVLVTQNKKAIDFLKELAPDFVHNVKNAAEAMQAVMKLLQTD
ncbi:MAG: TIGR00725 family protein [Alphaproteobacteria bacterium]|nr:TIGR00725 family protein [Alphaproteobacteria bacterium]